MAYRAGAALMDMEMVHTTPPAWSRPDPDHRGRPRRGAHLLNANGERFMEKSAPNKMELASRDVVSRAEQRDQRGPRCRAGGSGIFLDVTVVPRKPARGAARDRQPRPRPRGRGHHPRTDHDPPRPALHHGGCQDRYRRPHPDRASTPPARWPVSRPRRQPAGANSLLDTLIFGRRSGEHAAERAARMVHAEGRYQGAVARGRRADRRDHRAPPGLGACRRSRASWAS